jgi:hypothetical protein
MFVDSDDWIHPEIVERLYHGLTCNNAQIAMSDYGETNESNGSIILLDLCDFVTYDVKSFFNEVFWRNNAMGETAWGKLYKKELFDGIRYPVGKIHEDTYTTYKVAFKADKIVVTHAKMYYYYQRENSIIHSKSGKQSYDRYDSLAVVMDFLFENDFLTAYKDNLTAFLSKQAEGYKYFYDKKETEKAKIILKNTKRHFKQGKKLFKWKVKSHAYLYEAAYPRLMKWYWILLSVVNKIRKKVFRKND